MISLALFIGAGIAAWGGLLNVANAKLSDSVRVAATLVSAYLVTVMIVGGLSL